MAKYRRVEVGMWTDGDFMSWSAPGPSAQFLWLYLLTGKRTLPIPGVVVAREAVVADDLGWSTKALREAFAEVSAKERVKADWKVGLVVLRRALFDADGNPRKTNAPQSANVLRSWAKCWGDVPDCHLKSELYLEVRAFSEALGEGFAKAFREAWPHPSRIQDAGAEDRIQEQDTEKNSPPEGSREGPFDFELAYQSYPRKQGKKDGLAKLAKTVKTQADYDALLLACRRMGEEWAGKDTEFCPHFSTFVNQERWRDGQLPFPKGAGNGGHYKHTGDEKYAGGEVDL